MPSPNIWGAMRGFDAINGFQTARGMIGRVFHADSINGSDSNDGKFAGLGLEMATQHGFLTIAKALSMMSHYDTLVLSGVFKEQVVAPAIYDIQIIGSGVGLRQATNNGIATGGGASWLAPAAPAATTPLIRVVAQGWKFSNIQMAPVAASACITFDRRETAAIPDSSHGTVSDCYFSTGGASGYGVELIEVKNIKILDNLFEALTGASGTAIKGTAGDGFAAKSYLTIKRNKFVLCINDVNIPSTDYSDISENKFFSTNPIEAGKRIVLNGSTGRNRVLDNSFSDVAADVTIAKGYTPAANDIWRNWPSNQTVPIVVVPA